MDWGLFWTLYLQVFLLFPLLWLISYTLSSGFTAAIGNAAGRVLKILNKHADEARGKKIV